MKNIKLIAIFTIYLYLFSGNAVAQVKEVYSPDKNIKVIVDIKDHISYSVSFKNEKLIAPSVISMNLGSKGVIGQIPKLNKSNVTCVNEVLSPVVPGKRKTILNSYNQLSLSFKGNYELSFKVFNDGIAYRWTTTFKDSLTVFSEEANFAFTKNDSVFFPTNGKDFVTKFQNSYDYLSLDSISPDKMAITPTLVDVAKGPKVAITEADLRDYPGMFLRGNGNFTLTGKFAPYVLNANQRLKIKGTVTKRPGYNEAIRADYLAKTLGTRSFPWRVLCIVEKDTELISTDIVYCLAEKSKIEDTSWIKPGKIAWDWWNANNIYNVDFRAGINFETYKYFIDFAAINNIEYIVLDEGWSETENVLKLKPEIKLPELIKYAQERGVGIHLWVDWKALEENLDVATKQFQEWGIKGIKMDFMNRDDQYIVNYLEKVASLCAQRKLMVNFHGTAKPTGLHRTYPNIMTYEGVAGLENCKWSTQSDPVYDVTFPFIRMMAGPADYTPGAMNTAQKREFRDIRYNPMGMGTRCHQLAMYVVYESPLQMLADSPTNYMKEQESLSFIKAVPTVWDETIVLDGKVGKYIVIARKSGDKWYLAAMTNWDAREVTVDIAKIGAGNFQLDEFVDGINADRCGNDYKKITRKISASNPINIKMAPGGGWAAILHGKN